MLSLLVRFGRKFANCRVLGTTRPRRSGALPTRNQLTSLAQISSPNDNCVQASAPARGRLGGQRQTLPSIIAGCRGLGALALFAVTMVMLAVCGCGGNATNNPTPQITGLIPSEITAGSQAFTLFVSGSQFISTTTVQWNGSDVPTAFDKTSGELLAAIPAANVQAQGEAQITVTSPAPGGGRSFAVAFTINPGQNGGPTITSISPNSAAVNSQAFTLTVTGTNFVCGDYVTWNGGIRTPPAGATCSSTQLTAQILATDLTLAQTASVAVHTSQLGTASPSASFQVESSKSASVRFPQLVSATPRSGTADGQSSSPAISGDGRYVAFYSKAKNLVAGGAAGNVFLRDTCLGQGTNCSAGTTPVDIALNGAAPNGAAANHVAISADGRYVAFTSTAANLTRAPLSSAAYPRVFVRDMCVGALAAAPCSTETEIASLDPNGNVIGGIEPSISADGRFVAFASPVATGESAMSTGANYVVMIRDTCHAAGTACTPRTVVASMEGENQVAVDPKAASAVSASGRYIVFVTAAREAAPSQVFVRDTCLGNGAACMPSTTLISAAQNGAVGNAASSSPAISADGRFVVFASAASNLAGDPAGGEQIYLRDTCAGSTAPFGCAPSTAQIFGNGAVSGDAGVSYSPAISQSGRYVTYLAHAESGDSAPSSATAAYIILYDTCSGAVGPCSPHAAELSAADSAGNEVPLIGDIRVPVPVTDGGFVTFFTTQPIPTARASGLGDVFLTTTPFHQ